MLRWRCRCGRVGRRCRLLLGVGLLLLLRVAAPRRLLLGIWRSGILLLQLRMLSVRLLLRILLRWRWRLLRIRLRGCLILWLLLLCIGIGRLGSRLIALLLVGLLLVSRLRLLRWWRRWQRRRRLFRQRRLRSSLPLLLLRLRRWRLRLWGNLPLLLWLSGLLPLLLRGSLPLLLLPLRLRCHRSPLRTARRRLLWRRRGLRLDVMLPVSVGLL